MLEDYEKSRNSNMIGSILGIVVFALSLLMVLIVYVY